MIVGNVPLNLMIKLAVIEENESIEIIFDKGNTLDDGISTQNEGQFRIYAKISKKNALKSTLRRIKNLNYLTDDSGGL